MALVDRTHEDYHGLVLAKRFGCLFKAFWRRFASWRARQFDLSELTDAQCRDVGINLVDLEATRVRRSDLIK